MAHFFTTMLWFLFKVGHELAQGIKKSGIIRNIYFFQWHGGKGKYVNYFINYYQLFRIMIERFY